MNFGAPFGFPCPPKHGYRKKGKKGTAISAATHGTQLGHPRPSGLPGCESFRVIDQAITVVGPPHAVPFILTIFDLLELPGRSTHIVTGSL